MMNLTKLGFRKDYDPNNKVIKQEDIEFQGKILFVSTVDLGLDHSWGKGPELYWETMIFVNYIIKLTKNYNLKIHRFVHFFSIIFQKRQEKYYAQRCIESNKTVKGGS